MSVDIRSSTSAVPEDIHDVLFDGTQVKSKVGHVAKFSSTEDTISHDDERYPDSFGKLRQLNCDDDQQISIENSDLSEFKKEKKHNEFIGFTKEELKGYINNPYWKRIRWIIGILYVLILLVLFVGSIVLILFCSHCPPKPKLIWYEKQIIYEIDVTKFRDTNEDTIGDIRGVQQKIEYLEKNSIKSILLQSSIFNSTRKSTTLSDGQNPRPKNIDFLTFDQQVVNDNQLQNLTKILRRKDMHLIIDLPLSSTHDSNGYQWYGSTNPLSIKINNPCIENEFSLGCRYYTEYGRLPLDFNEQEMIDQAQSRLHYWLAVKKVDGVRLDLPLELNSQTHLYNISYKTIDQWIQIKNEIEKKTKAKLILFDVPFDLNDLIIRKDVQNRMNYPIIPKQSLINGKELNERIGSFKSIPTFWQLGSRRINDQIENELSKEMILTTTMLFSGTPIILFGEELNLDQKSNRFMAWTPDKPSGGFSSCLSDDCQIIFSSYQMDFSEKNVKREEAIGTNDKDSLLRLFRRLSKLREYQSFLFGSFRTGFHFQSNTFWFIREAQGHRGYIIVLNLDSNADQLHHLSLYEITNHLVPKHIHYEYQWPSIHFPTSDKSHINSDNLLIHSQSINIFWWTPKLIQPKILFKKSKQHSTNL